MPGEVESAPESGGAAFVAVVEATDFREFEDTPFRDRLNASRRWGVFGQGQMGPRPMVIDAITGQDAAQVALAKYDDVVETLAPE